MIKEELLQNFLGLDIVSEYHWTDDPEDPESPLFSLEDVAQICPPGHRIEVSPYGALVAEDGTLYVVLRAMYHGVVSALLYPELAAQFGYECPHRNCSVFKYQRFQFILDHVSSSVVIGANTFAEASISFNTEALPTKAQAFRAVEYLVEVGYS
jgi:hypothetical protein